jgi:hypothetical protein
MNHLRTHILAALLVSLCLATQTSYRTSARESPDGTSQVNQDLSTWQLVSLTGKGIKFKLPQDWRHDGLDMESVQETFTNQEIDWNTPNKSLQNTDKIRIFMTSYHNGFVSFGHLESREEMLADKLDRVKTFAQAKAPGSSYSEIQIVKVSGVEGVFRLMRANSKDLGSRLSLQWTGYRAYQGKAQEIDISISSGTKGEGLLRTVFSTLELEQDTK